MLRLPPTRCKGVTYALLLQQVPVVVRAVDAITNHVRWLVLETLRIIRKLQPNITGLVEIVAGKTVEERETSHMAEARLRTKLHVLARLAALDRSNLRLVKAEGNVVTTTSQLRGTHKGNLDMSAMGLGVFPPTGKTFSNPEEKGEAVVEDGKIKSIHMEAAKDSGVAGMLLQLGLQPALK